MRKTLSLMVAVAGMAFGAPVITIIPSIGTGDASPNGANYASNALTALQGNLTTFGSGAAQYNRLVGPANPSQIIDTSGAFNSWLGIAAPNALFNSEFGNRLYFGIRAVGANAADQFSLHQFVYVDQFFINDTIYYNTPADTYDGTTVIGVQYGLDGQLGGGDDVILNGGQAGDTPVNAFFYRGFNVAFLPDSSLAGLPPQDQLNGTASNIGAFAIPLPAPGAQACISRVAGTSDCAVASLVTAAVPIEAVPEPSTYALMGLGLAALAYARRRLA